MKDTSPTSSTLQLLIKLFFLTLVLQTVFRSILTFYFKSNLNHTQFYKIFLIGIRFDLSIAAYVIIISTLILLFSSVKSRLWITWQTIAILTIFFLEFSTFSFMKEFGQRPNRLMIEYLSNPREVFSTIWKAEQTASIVLIILLITCTSLAFRYLQKSVLNLQTLSIKDKAKILSIIMPISFICARGSLGSNPIGYSDSYFSNNPYSNELAMNSSYTFFKSIETLKFEQDPTSTYGHYQTPEQTLDIVKKNSFKDEYVKSNNPLMYKIRSKNKTERPYNLVIILEESMGAEYVGRLGGRPLTPSLDKLFSEGMSFSNLYATGTRSARGIEAIISGYLPTPGMSTIKLGLSQNNFFTVANALSDAGYNTSFIYGGDSNFDNMRTFSLNNGFKEVIDQRNYQSPLFVGTWGVSDEDLFNKANEWFEKQGDKPFFSLVFTVSNHGPYEFPDGRIELYDQKKDTVNNTVKYADYALGQFFEIARTKAYYDHTVFLVIADHNFRSVGNELVPIESMRIPGLIIGKPFSKMTYEKPASQIDLLTTILPNLGVNLKVPLIGHDLLSLPKDYPGRAILQFNENHAYLKGTQVIIHTPNAKPLNFIYMNKKLYRDSKPIDQSLLEEARAHIYLPSYLYLNKLYSAH